MNCFSFLVRTGLSVRTRNERVSRLVRGDFDEVGRAVRQDYPVSVAATWDIAMEDLERRRPAAAWLLELCAFMNPDGISTTRLIYASVFRSRPIFQHVKLDAVLDLFDPYNESDTRLDYAPWSEYPRPLRGLLHGSYAHAAVVDFWRRTAKRSEAQAAAHFACWREQTWEALGVLAHVRSLTEAGGWLFVDQQQLHAERGSCWDRPLKRLRPGISPAVEVVVPLYGDDYFDDEQCGRDTWWAWTHAPSSTTSSPPAASTCSATTGSAAREKAEPLKAAGQGGPRFSAGNRLSRQTQ